MHKKSPHINNMHTNNSHKNHHTNIMRINIFVAINKYKAKIYDHCMYTLIIIKKFIIIYKKKFCLLNIRMMNLSFDELRLIAQIRNISDYENKSKEDFIKTISETKPETPKPEKTKLEIRVNKRKFKKLRKYFDELRHKLSKKEIDRYRKNFYVAKNKNIFLNQK